MDSITTDLDNTTSSSAEDEDHQSFVPYLLLIYSIAIVIFVTVFCLISKYRNHILQFVVLLLSGLSNVFTGLLLFYGREVFNKFDGLLILVQPLMGLKGNLEMTMASRMCTAMHVKKHLVSAELICKEVTADLILVQSQATVVAFFVSFFAVISLAFDSGVDGNNVIRIFGISLFTANIASLLLGEYYYSSSGSGGLTQIDHNLGILVSAVIVITKSFDYDPDDFATPIAASIGDLVTLVIMAFLANFISNLRSKDEFPIETFIVLIILIFLVEPILLYLSFGNPTTRPVLVHGWTPIIIASLISSFSGIVFTHSTQRHPKLATFQPLFNGFAGNCAALLASRISSSLHRMGSIGTTDDNFKTLVSPYYAFYSEDNKNSRTTLILTVIVIPSQILYILVIAMIQKTSEFKITTPFMCLYLCSSVVQISVLLYLTYILSHILWRLKYDPDIYVIPIVTAMADFTGTVLLFLIYLILYVLDDINSMKTDL